MDIPALNSSIGQFLDEKFHVVTSLCLDKLRKHPKRDDWEKPYEDFSLEDAYLREVTHQFLLSTERQWLSDATQNAERKKAIDYSKARKNFHDTLQGFDEAAGEKYHFDHPGQASGIFLGICENIRNIWLDWKVKNLAADPQPFLNRHCDWLSTLFANEKLDHGLDKYMHGLLHARARCLEIAELDPKFILPSSQQAWNKMNEQRTQFAELYAERNEVAPAFMPIAMRNYFEEYDRHWRSWKFAQEQCRDLVSSITNLSRPVDNPPAVTFTSWLKKLIGIAPPLSAEDLLLRDIERTFFDAAMLSLSSKKAEVAYAPRVLDFADAPRRPGGDIDLALQAQHTNFNAIQTRSGGHKSSLGIPKETLLAALRDSAIKMTARLAKHESMRE